MRKEYILKFLAGVMIGLMISYVIQVNLPALRNFFEIRTMFNG